MIAAEGADGEGIVCGSCGTKARAAAVFCRACGARLEPRPGPESPQAAPSPAASPGGSRPDPAARRPTPPPSPAPSPRRAGARRGITALLVVGACVVLGGLVGGVAYLITSDDSGPVDGPDPPQPIGIDSGDGTSTTTTVPEETDGDDADGEGGQGSGTSGLEPGRYVQAGSFRLPENAEQEVARLQADGIDVFTIPSAGGDELLPGFQVLLVGPLSGGGEERRVLADLRRARVSGIRKDLTPSPTIAGPEDAAGTWSGDLELSDSDRPRFDATARIRISIDPDGLSGTIRYRFQGCRGSLSLAEQSDLMLSYEESLHVGRCPAGGVWHLRPAGDELIATGLYEDSDMIVHGTATRE